MELPLQYHDEVRGLSMEEKYCDLRLSSHDGQLLRRMLDVRLSELRTELARTENSAFQHALHQDLDRLEEIQSQLSRTLNKIAASGCLILLCYFIYYRNDNLIVSWFECFQIPAAEFQNPKA